MGNQDSAYGFKYIIVHVWRLSIFIEVPVPFIVSIRIVLMFSRLSHEMNEKVFPLQCSRSVAANIQPVTKKSTRRLHKQSYMIHSDGITNYEHINHSTTYNLCYYSTWQIRNEKHIKISKESIIHPNLQLDRSFDKVGWYLTFMCFCYMLSP